jgi:hypothetical protein
VHAVKEVQVVKALSLSSLAAVACLAILPGCGKDSETQPTQGSGLTCRVEAIRLALAASHRDHYPCSIFWVSSSALQYEVSHSPFDEHRRIAKRVKYFERLFRMANLDPLSYVHLWVQLEFGLQSMFLIQVTLDDNFKEKVTALTLEIQNSDGNTVESFSDTDSGWVLVGFEPGGSERLRAAGCSVKSDSLPRDTGGSYHTTCSFLSRLDIASLEMVSVDYRQGFLLATGYIQGSVAAARLRGREDYVVLDNPLTGRDRVEFLVESPWNNNLKLILRSGYISPLSNIQSLTAAVAELNQQLDFSPGSAGTAHEQYLKLPEYFWPGIRECGGWPDPWGSPIRLVIESDGSVVWISAGPDRHFESTDDIRIVR